jgi:Domain of unknown function (DUF5122) beta-propeller
MSAVGALDSTSGLTGTVVAPAFSGFATASGKAVTVLGHGLVAAGWVGPYFPGPSAFAVARYQGNGNLDPVFGNGVGYVTTEFASDSDDRANALVRQQDGKIVVAGYHDPGWGRTHVRAGPLSR